MQLSWSSAVVVAFAALSEAAPASVVSRALPLVQSNQLRRVIYRSELLAKGQKFMDFAYSHPGKNRYIGTPGHNLTVNYLYDTLVATGYYDVSIQPFYVDSIDSESASVNGAEIEAAAMESTPGGIVTAPLVPVANTGCAASDYPAGVAGNIALVSRGACSFQLKSELSAAAGAVGLVVYNNVANVLLQGTLGPPRGAYVPSFGITMELGQTLVAAIAAGTPQVATLNINVLSVLTYNVIAETKAGDHDNVLALGAHTDSVVAGPGINDNGSGSIGILEVALQLTKFSVNNAVRFGWWSGEEEGLLGATYYVSTLSDEELSKIRVYLNFDMIASPNFVYQIYDGDGSAFGISGAPGSAEVEKLWEDYFPKDAQLVTEPTAFDGRSDYGPFLDVGVAAGGLTSGADEVKTPEQVAIWGGTAGAILDPNYHQAGDTLKNLNIAVWSQITKAIAHAVATYARSWESFPPKETKREVVKRGVSKFERKGSKWIV